MKVNYRVCTAADVALAAPLILASGPKAFRYVLSKNNEDEALEFLRYSFVRGEGQFGYKNHIALEADGILIAVGTMIASRNSFRYLLTAMKHIFSYYSFIDALKVAACGLKLESVIKPPKKNVVSLAHIAVSPELRGKGIGARLMTYLINKAKTDGFEIAGLDVAETNPGARGLYERLGFVEIDFNKKDLRSQYGEVCGHSYMELPLG